MSMRIGHLRLSVTGLERWTWFAQHIVGLRETERRDGTVYFSSNTRHHQLELTEGPAYMCTALGVDVDNDAELEAIGERARDGGLAVTAGDTARPGIGRLISLEVPGGPTIEVCTGVEALAREPYDVYGVRPKKLGHVTLAAEDAAAVEQVFVDVLGFRVSDRITGVLAWLRCNEDHHGVGIMGGDPGIQHYAFELESWGSFQTLADHVTRHGVHYIWGPGRHGPGNNLFAYFEDPDGGMVECFADILRIEDEATYRPREWPNDPASLNQWGPAPVPEWFAYRTPFATAVREAVA